MSKNHMNKNLPKRTNQPQAGGPNSWLKQAIKPMDIMIGIAAVYIFYATDFDNMSTFDLIFIVTFAIWFVLTLARCVIYYRKS
ncbi:hypothetical protein [Mitsuokella sp.]|uniref:hypothetical protein n=1 Tax=unclassified Mitsuokella TaxID=2637239 RepID=UPI003D7D07D6